MDELTEVIGAHRASEVIRYFANAPKESADQNPTDQSTADKETKQ